MLIRGLTISVVFAALAAPAYAQDSSSDVSSQDNPATRQTDQSEDAYRSSQRLKDTSTIFKDIKASRSGIGGADLNRQIKAIDRLNADSRRHLITQRAKARAEAPIGAPLDAEYVPSETAKLDSYVAEQEKAAWEELLLEANNAGKIIQGPRFGELTENQTGGPQPTGTGSGQTEPQKLSENAELNDRSGPSLVRGGSTTSAAAILDQIKGRDSSKGPQPNADGSPPPPKPPAKKPSEEQAERPKPPKPPKPSDNEERSESRPPPPPSEASEQRPPPPPPEEKAAAEAAKQDETLSPLERLKRDSINRDDTGGRTSASDYLRRTQE